MHWIKSLLPFLCAAALCLPLAACGDNAAEPSALLAEAAEKQALRQAAQSAAPEPTQNADAVQEAIPAVETVPGEEAAPAPSEGADVDLTAMTDLLASAELSNILYLPEEYEGKTIRLRGECVSAYYEETDTTYYSVTTSDAAACCVLALEYLLPGGDYPPDGTEATVTGEFESYEEDGILYARLKDAVVEV